MLKTNITGIQKAIETNGVDNILCVITTTSCFAPRAVDNVEGVSQLCSNSSIFHLVNNAYGLQSSKCSHQIQQGDRCIDHPYTNTFQDLFIFKTFNFIVFKTYLELGMWMSTSKVLIKILWCQLEARL